MVPDDAEADVLPIVASPTNRRVLARQLTAGRQTANVSVDRADLVSLIWLNGALLTTELRNRLEDAEITRDDALEELSRTKTAMGNLQAAYDKLEKEAFSRDAAAKAQAAELRELITHLKAENKDAGQDRIQLLQERHELAQQHEHLSDTIERLHQRSASLSPVEKEIGRLRDSESPFVQSRNSSANNLVGLQIKNVAKDRQIQKLEQRMALLEEELLEVAEAGSPRTLQLEARLAEVESENQSLRKDNESYQTLLQDQTINGEFATSEFMQSAASYSRYQSIRDSSSGPHLASELDAVDEGALTDDAQDIENAGRKELESEVMKLQDTNKALTLYINTIVGRMLNTEGFEHLFARDDSTMPVKGSHTKSDKGSGLLQCTKSVFASSSGQNQFLEHDTRANDDDIVHFRDSFATNEWDRRSSNKSRLLPHAKEHSPSPARAGRLSSSSGQQSTSNASGLRTLQSAAAADQISSKEARRLSAQFAATSSGAQHSPSPENKHARRSSWLGWLSSKPETHNEDSKTKVANAEHSSKLESVGEACANPTKDSDIKVDTMTQP